MIHDPDTRLYGRTPGLPDEAYDSDGLVTRHPLRAAALAALRPLPGEVLWDLGAGAGSVAIEWCRSDPANRAIGVERDPVRAARARENAARLSLPGQVEIREGSLPEAIAGLPAPDAVFIGGGASEEVVTAALAALRGSSAPRLVVHGVTLETEALVVALHACHGGSLHRLALETAQPLGRLRGWTPARTVIQWLVIPSAS